MITLDQGVVIAGRYTLVRPLAKGGMGSVWIARHRDLEIDVTVKFMAPSLVAEAEARMRFEREARVAARLRSQYVVQVHDYGVEDETPYIIMELLKGESLSTRLDREGRLHAPVMARLLVQICKALRTAHEAGLVHRDLKPGNVFLALKDDDEVVKVLDFGIAKTGTLGEAQTDTDSGVLLGSVHYMSPEQIRSSRAVDHRSDLWSVAVILYRVLTGRLPFPGANLGDVLVRVCTDAAPPPSQEAPDLPAQIDRFFERALARDPEQRFQSAPELAEGFCSIALTPARSRPPAPAPTPQVAAPPAPAPTPQVAAPAPQVITLPAPTPWGAPPPRPAPLPQVFAPTAQVVAPAPQAPAPASFVPAPQIKLTMRMDASPLAPERAEPAKAWNEPAATSAPRFAPPQLAPGPQTAPWAPAIAAAPTIPFASDPGTGSIRAIAASAPAIDSWPRAAAQPAAAPASRRPTWPVWAIAGTVTLAVILGLLLRSRGASDDAGTTTAASSTPPVTTAPEAPSAARPATGTPDSSAATAPLVSATSSAAAPRALASSSAAIGSPKAPTSAGALPRVGPKTKVNPLDRSD